MASCSPYETFNLDVKCTRYARGLANRNHINEYGESRQQTHYFHCDQIGIPREMTDKDGNLLWLGNYTG
ncbi:MAG: RHS domain-containing protein [Veillonella sp.]|uniref:RHS domain-containing protein n=1 Tax=Veillonella sp. TaxID=1926307 RepID=UPI0034281672|nr:RHS domain-containing protein [Veillonella sp.]